MKPIDKRISELEQQLREAKAEKERISLENPTTVAGRIKKTLKLKSMSQQEFSDLLGIGKSYTSMIVNGKCGVSVELLGKIAKILDVSCDYLILGDTNGGEDIS